MSIEQIIDGLSLRLDNLKAALECMKDKRDTSFYEHRIDEIESILEWIKK